MYIKVKDRFSVIPHSLLYNASVSAKAKGLYAYIQGKPDGWDFSAERIALEMSDGRDGIRAGLSELEDAGYLIRERKNAKGGRFSVEYELLSSPTTEKPSSAEAPPMTENPTTKKPSSKKERISNIYTHSSLRSEGVCASDGKNENSLVIKKEQERPTPVAVAPSQTSQTLQALSSLDQETAWIHDVALRIGWEERDVLTEVRAFALYWLEKSEGGKKCRYQMEKVFDVNLRFSTWMRRAKKPFHRSSASGGVVQA